MTQVVTSNRESVKAPTVLLQTTADNSHRPCRRDLEQYSSFQTRKARSTSSDNRVYDGRSV